MNQYVHRWSVDAPKEIPQPRMRIEVVWAEAYDAVVRENARLQHDIEAGAAELTRLTLQRNDLVVRIEELRSAAEPHGLAETIEDAKRTIAAWPPDVRRAMGIADEPAAYVTGTVPTGLPVLSGMLVREPTREPCRHGNASGHCQHCLDAL